MEEAIQAREKATRHVENLYSKICGIAAQFRKTYESMAAGNPKNELVQGFRDLAEAFETLRLMCLADQRPSKADIERLAEPFVQMQIKIPQHVFGQMIPALAREFFDAQDECIRTDLLCQHLAKQK